LRSLLEKLDLFTAGVRLFPIQRQRGKRPASSKDVGLLLFEIWTSCCPNFTDTKALQTLLKVTIIYQIVIISLWV
jgi:hypothetical protein